MQKQLAFMLGSQQIYLELNDELEDYDDLVEIMSNAHLNNNFLALAREVSLPVILEHPGQLAGLIIKKTNVFAISPVVSVPGTETYGTKSTDFLYDSSWTSWNRRCQKIFTKVIWNLTVSMRLSCPFEIPDISVSWAERPNHSTTNLLHRLPLPIGRLLSLTISLYLSAI
jgi:hypothetical protein